MALEGACKYLPIHLYALNLSPLTSDSRGYTYLYRGTPMYTEESFNRGHPIYTGKALIGVTLSIQKTPMTGLYREQSRAYTEKSPKPLLQLKSEQSPPYSGEKQGTTYTEKNSKALV